MKGVWWVSQKSLKRESSLQREGAAGGISAQVHRLPSVSLVSELSHKIVDKSKSHLCIEDGPTLLNNHSTPLHPVCLLSSRFSVIV